MLETIDHESASELTFGYDVDDLKYQGRTFIDKHRWYNKYLIAFKDDQGDLLGFYYDEPATEEQEGMDTFEGEPVPVFPVEKREKITYEWVEVKQ